MGDVCLDLARALVKRVFDNNSDFFFFFFFFFCLFSMKPYLVTPSSEPSRRGSDEGSEDMFFYQN